MERHFLENDVLEQFVRLQGLFSLFELGTHTVQLLRKCIQFSLCFVDLRYKHVAFLFQLTPPLLTPRLVAAHPGKVKGFQPVT